MSKTIDTEDKPAILSVGDIIYTVEFDNWHKTVFELTDTGGFEIKRHKLIKETPKKFTFDIATFPTPKSGIVLERRTFWKKDVTGFNGSQDVSVAIDKLNAYYKAIQANNDNSENLKAYVKRKYEELDMEQLKKF